MSVCSIVSDVVVRFATLISPCDQSVSMRHSTVSLQYAEIRRDSDALSSHLGMSAVQTRATGAVTWESVRCRPEQQEQSLGNECGADESNRPRTEE